MAEPAKKEATYDDLYSISDNMTGEIIDGELIVTPRPSRKHIYTASALEVKIGAPYQFGEGGPGGWIILVEPEIRFSTNFLVPDLSGWKRERFPVEEETNWISVAPDWVCEVLSPGTAREDRVKKMSIYASHFVPYYWLIDPSEKILETLKLEEGKWIITGVFCEGESVRAEPFPEIAVDLGSLWLL